MVVIEEYRDPWLAEKFGDFVGFYPRQFSFLDNSSAYAVEYNDRRFPTAEHAYQAAKFWRTAPNVAEAISTADSPDEAKHLAKIFSYKQDDNWDSIKVDVMELILRSKIEVNPFIAGELLKTGDNLLCEDSPYDDFWGIGINREGQNQLGKLWMKIRNELFRKTKSELQM